MDLILNSKPAGTTLTRWLYDELRRAILDGRLRRGEAVPATRALAAQYGLSRRIVVNVFEQLGDEGYLQAVTGSGTRVSENIPEDYLPGRVIAPVRAARRYAPLRARPFLPVVPAVEEFPVGVWSRLEARSLRRVGMANLTDGDTAGDMALRHVVAGYLGASRGVRCTADQVMITSGTQQSLDLVARVVVRRGDRVWMEDPGYTDAAEVFRLAGGRVVPVGVDGHGFVMPRRVKVTPRAVYLTPAHQFPLGVSLRLDRRLELLGWARKHGVVLIEDDYDSEFRFAGRPLPAMQGLAEGAQVFLLGTFNKVLFPALRLGYVVVPEEWMEAMLRLRRLTDRYPAALPQRTLAAFLEEGYFERYLRRMREMYGARLGVLRDAVGRHLAGALTLPEMEAGMHIPAYFEGGIRAEEVVVRARELELWTLARFALARTDLNGVLLGFAAFGEREIRKGVVALAQAIGG